MNESRPTYIRRDVFTGPAVLFGSMPPSWLPFAKRYFHDKNPLVARMFFLAPGSRENFFHFLIGYLLPLVHAQARKRFGQFAALDCGPLMTPILKQTLARCNYDFKIVAPAAIRHPVMVEAWDRLDHPWKSPGAVREAVEIIREAWRDHRCTSGNCARSEHILIQRSPAHAHYLNGSSEFPGGYGTSKREISNLEELSMHLSRSGIPHSVYEPGAHNLGCQIEAFSSARRILGFRGADWANLIWSSPDARAFMLDHRPPAKTLGRFMKQLGIQHEFVVVSSPRSAVHPEDAVRFFTAK